MTDERAASQTRATNWTHDDMGVNRSLVGELQLRIGARSSERGMEGGSWPGLENSKRPLPFTPAGCFDSNDGTPLLTSSHTFLFMAYVLPS